MKIYEDIMVNDLVLIEKIDFSLFPNFLHQQLFMKDEIFGIEGQQLLCNI